MMMRKMLFGIVAGLLVFSVGVRAEDNDSADQKVAADKAADRTALKGDFAQERADKKQRREDRHELSKDRRADNREDRKDRRENHRHK